MKKIILIFLFYILIIKPSYAEKILTVLPFETISIDNDLKNSGKSISENISIALNYNKGIHTNEYIKINKVLKETGLSISMLSNKENAIKVGKYLNSDITLFGSLELSNNLYTLNYSYIDKNAKIIRNSKISSKDIITLQKALLQDFFKTFKISVNNNSLKIAEITNSISNLNNLSQARHYFYLNDYNKSIEYLNKARKSNNIKYILPEEAIINTYNVLMLKSSGENYINKLNILEEIIKKAFQEKENILYAQKSSLIFNYIKGNKLNEKTFNYLSNLYPLDSELSFIKFLYISKEENIKKAISLNPFNSIYYYYYSSYLYDKRLVDKSIEMIDKAINLNKTNIYYLLAKANIFFSTGRMDLAIPIYDSILSIDKNNLQANYYLAKSYNYKEDLEKTEKYYQNMINIDPNNYLPYYELGKLHLEEGYTDKAIEYFSNAVKLNPKNSEAYYFLGRAYKLNDNKEEAIKFYKKAIELNKNFIEAYYDMGIALKQSGKVEEAENSFNKAIEINKDFSEAYLNLGVIYYEREDFKKAISLYQKAISLKPDYYRAYNNLGSIYLKMKNYTEAEKNFNLSIKYNKDYSLTYNNLGVLFQELGKKEEAKKNFDKACDLGYLPACN